MVNNHEELIGKRFGKLLVEKVDGKISQETAYFCRCDCGKTKRVRKGSLTSNNTNSCGCSRQKEMLGKKFGNWIVIKYSHKSKRGTHYWTCECQCNNKTVRDIEGTSLRAKRSLSCGCRHPSITHGMTGTRLYKTWDGMKYRCLNKNSNNYFRYGSRGIKVCEEWLKFENFYEWAMKNGYTDELSIDRIDNDGNYEPSNCRWVDMKTQANNKSRNLYFTIKGETKTLAEWIDSSNVDYETARKRLRMGWDIESVISKETKEHVRDRIIHIEGKGFTLLEWSDLTGINISTLRVRYSKGKRDSDLIKITNGMKLNKGRTLNNE